MQKLPNPQNMAVTFSDGARSAVSLGMGMNEYQRLTNASFLLACLKKTGGNQVKAAKLAGIHRNTIWRLIDEAGLRPAMLQIKRAVLSGEKDVYGKRNGRREVLHEGASTRPGDVHSSGAGRI